MKKSISINISGMLFNIEEDAYDRLKYYLDDIKHYFAGYEASGEIVADIESRIAEIFSTKISPVKQVITLTDVEALIAQMGNIQDFAAVEDAYEEPKYTNTNGHTYTTTDETREGRRLYRDSSRKVIGGVAAGIADYLRIDPLWVRLLMVIILFDFFLTFSFSSALFIGYIVLWIALPERPHYEKMAEKRSKKMFRNPDDQVIAGVAGGLGAFFGVDALLIRILFVVLFIVGGSGLLLYILLWVIMPKARTLTDKMQMQGEPVTLANIEHQVKKNLNLKEGEEESLPVKILLFPFRLISAIFAGGSRGARPLLQFIAEAVRVVAGLILAAGGFFTLLAMLLTVAILLGTYEAAYINLFDLETPLELLRNTVPDYLIVSVLLLAAIPALFVLLLGVSLLANRSVLPRSVSWTLAGVWVIALITTAVLLPELVINYRTDDYFETRSTFSADSSKTLVLQMERDNWREFQNVDLIIRGTTDSVMLLEKRIWGHGANSEEAREHAQLASYPVVQKGDTLQFAGQLELPNDKPFYGQHAKATLYIPYGQPFTMEYGLKKILYNTLSPWGYGVNDLDKNTFTFNKQGELECLTCPAESREKARDRADFTYIPSGRALNYKDFDRLQVGSSYRLTVVQGPDYKVTVTGNEEQLEHMEVKQQNGTLSFSRDDWNDWWDAEHDEEVHIYVTVPTLTGLSLSGASNANVKLQQEKALALDLSGASELKGELEVQELDVHMSGSSELQLQGKARRLEADLSGASEIEANEFKTAIAQVDLSGASTAYLWVTERLEGDASGASDLVYRGNPGTSDVDLSSGADVRRSAD